MIMKRLVIILLVLLPISVLSQKEFYNTEKVIEWAEKNKDEFPKQSIDTLERMERTIPQKNYLDRAILLDKLTFIYFFDLSSYDLALKTAQRIDSLATVSGDKRVKILYFENMGMLYYESKTSIQKGYEFFRKAYELSLKEKSNFHIEFILNNYAVSIMNETNYREALDKFRLADEYAKRHGDKRQQSIIHNNMGICYLIQRKMKEAETYLNSAYQIAQKSAGTDDDAERASYLAKFYLDRNELDKAYRFIQVALKYKSSIRSKQIISFIYKTSSDIQKKKRNLPAALNAMDTCMMYRDSIDFSNMSKQLLAIESNVRIKEIQFQNKLENEKMKNLRKTENIRYLVIILILVIISFLVFTLFLRIRNRSRLSEIENARVNLEKENLALELSANEREVTAKSLYIFEKDTLINNMMNTLQKLETNSQGNQKEEIQKAINDLKFSVNNKSWDEFELRFKKVHPNFYRTMETDFPRLTLNEKRLCAFLVMDMTTKDISTITGQTAHSINIARSRLRKKLGLTNEEINLSQFLGRFK
jgi:tetratricopeptide (TPR) repeat protein